MVSHLCCASATSVSPYCDSFSFSPRVVSDFFFFLCCGFSPCPLACVRQLGLPSSLCLAASECGPLPYDRGNPEPLALDP